MATKKRPQSELLTWLRGQYTSHERAARMEAKAKTYWSAAEHDAMASAYAFTILHVEREAQKASEP